MGLPPGLWLNSRKTECAAPFAPLKKRTHLVKEARLKCLCAYEVPGGWRPAFRNWRGPRWRASGIGGWGLAVAYSGLASEPDLSWKTSDAVLAWAEGDSVGRVVDVVLREGQMDEGAA